MTDLEYSVLNGGSRKKLVDMGDGTVAERVVAVIEDNDGVAGANSPLGPGTDRSGNIALGGTAQLLSPANAARRSLTGQNISAAELWINEVGNPAAFGIAGSYRIEPGATFFIATNQAVSIIGATTGQAFTATET